MLVICREGAAEMLTRIVLKALSDDVVLGLFTNNVTPSDTTVLTDLIECTGGGYAELTLTGTDWTITQGAPSVASYALQTFTFSGVPGVATIYGYFIKAGTVLLYAERFATAPLTIAAAGQF